MNDLDIFSEDHLSLSFFPLLATNYLSVYVTNSSKTLNSYQFLDIDTSIFMEMRVTPSSVVEVEFKRRKRSYLLSGR